MGNATKSHSAKNQAKRKSNFERMRAAAAEIREKYKATFPTQNPGRSIRSRQTEEVFLDGLRAGHTIAVAAYSIGVSRDTVVGWRKASEATRDPNTGVCTDDFADRWESAIEAGTDLIEQEAIRRATEGYERPVYQGGQLVGTTTEYSDTLMNLVLRGRRPQRYNTERHEHSGPGGKSIPMSMEIEFVTSKGEK